MDTDEITVKKFISELESLKDYIQDTDTSASQTLPSYAFYTQLIDHINPKFILTVAGAILGSLFIRYGLLAFVKYRALVNATTLQHLMKGNPSFPTLTPDMSVIIRAIDDKGHLNVGFTDDDEIPNERTQEIWEIIGKTVAFSQPEIHPIFIPNTHGAVSFIMIPLPSSTVDLISDLRLALQKSHFIPMHTPKRGPLKSIPFLKLNSSVVNGHLHPELVISALI